MAALSRLADALASGGYAARVVARLVELRRAGEQDFAAAWETVERELPAPGTWSRRYIASEPSAAEALREMCRRAWDGEGARLALTDHGPLVDVE